MPSTDIDERLWNRCFLALAPAASDARRIARLAAMAAPQDAHRLAAVDLHITLAFFGRIAPAAGHALAAVLQHLADAPLMLDMSGLACWPDPRRPRVLVAEFTASPALLALLAQVHGHMRALGLPIEQRPYRPHVTLARFPYRRAGAAQPAPVPMLQACRFDALALYTSLAPTPVQRYRPLAQAHLRGPLAH
ncbi:RNA 2',3'-cyclic phosphodiesterase [Verticiella sediminum]|uniref:RNA 2',3'-cyclic phosphodiesterase n=1 Tax=Verticiella sediminum TaxID=1247510 RepID=A0A556ABW8_9BURK|nr:RNA 2',3'-cyclic phosphodiesterase [Verticiella sediminum]TSH90371.1 RNA 2',3'-cyclic phosphodiesterase [Verticiella sediminum]